MKHEAPVNKYAIVKYNTYEKHYVKVSKIKSIHKHNALIIKNKSIYGV